jgi:hypothetical protein
MLAVEVKVTLSSKLGCAFGMSVYETGKSIEGGGPQQCWFGGFAWGDAGDGPWIPTPENDENDDIPEPDPQWWPASSACTWAATDCNNNQLSSLAVSCIRYRCYASLCDTVLMGPASRYWFATECGEGERDRLLADQNSHDFAMHNCAMDLSYEKASCRRWDPPCDTYPWCPRGKTSDDSDWGN